MQFKITTHAPKLLCQSILFLFLICQQVKTNSQNSFQMALDNTGFHLSDVLVNKQDDIFLYLLEIPVPPVSTNSGYIVPVIPQSSSVTGWQFTSPVGQIGGWHFSIFNDQNILFTSSGFPLNAMEPSSGILLNVNIITGDYWCKQTRSSGTHGSIMERDMDGNTIFVNSFHDFSPYPYYDLIELYKLDSLGNIIWKKGLIYYLNNIPCSNCIFLPRKLGISNNGNIFSTGIINTGHLISSDSYIDKFDSLGNSLITKKIKNINIAKMAITNDAIYLVDKGAYEQFMPYDFVNSESAILIKLDHDLNFIWAKKYYGDHFPYRTVELEETPSGNLMMSHTTFGSFPIILTELDTQGNILSQKGYPNFSPRMKIMSDGSLVFGSSGNFLLSGQTMAQPVIAKTDTNGDIDGCDTYPTCLLSDNVTIEMDTLFSETVDVFDLEDINIEIEPATFSFYEACNSPEKPYPDFIFPDTLCIHDFATTSATYNKLANAHEWHLIGPDIDSVETNLPDFSYRFDKAGTYRLIQTVWVLGCGYTYQKNITVLPDLELGITPEYICPDSPYEIRVKSSRSLKEYEWYNGLKNSTLPIFSSGEYSVSATDGFCNAYDTSIVVLALDSIGYEHPLFFPEDTIICESDLPFKLKIENTFSDIVLVNNDTVKNGIHYLFNDGSYTIFTELKNCPFIENFQLKVNDCRPAVYLPNIFSPNNDGLNDSFFPMGNNFEIIEFLIYDRWGGLLYSGSGDNAKWSPSSNTTQGVYTYRLHYSDIRTGEKHNLLGSVTLLR